MAGLWDKEVAKEAAKGGLAVLAFLTAYMGLIALLVLAWVTAWPLGIVVTLVVFFLVGYIFVYNDTKDRRKNKRTY